MGTPIKCKDKVASIWQGWYEGCMEYETDAEQFAALKTLFQMCFEGADFTPPEKPENGKMTMVQRAIRQTYFNFHGSIFATQVKTYSDSDAARRSALGSHYGKMGGRGRKKGAGESSDTEVVNDTPSAEIASKPPLASPTKPAQVQPVVPPIDDSNFVPVKGFQKESIYKSKFSTIEAFRDYLKNIGPTFSDYGILLKEEFIEFAYQRFVDLDWHDMKNRPISNIRVHLKYQVDAFKMKEKRDAEEKQKQELEKQREHEETIASLSAADLDELRRKRTVSRFD